MFTSNTTLGVIVALLFICAIIWFVIHHTKSLIATDKILFMLVFLVASFTAVWIVDRVVAFKIQLLTPEESKAIFEIDRNIIAIVLGYYFGSKKDSTTPNP